MDSETREPLLVVACRFVPNDQWLITHLDTSWTIKQVKHWILSKCNLANAPELPRQQRSGSPITFASTIRSTGGSFDENFNSGDEELQDSSFEAKYRTHRDFTERGQFQARHRSESSTDGSSTTVTATKSDLSTRYQILTFSNAHVLDDDFLLSWYNLRPYELLEMHGADSIVRLPRELITHYVRPYFEARARASKAVSRDYWETSREVFVDKMGGGGKTSKSGKERLVSSDPLAYAAKGKKKTKKTKLEWRDRWIVIHQGVLSLCNDRSESSSCHRVPLSSCIAIRGAEHIASSHPQSVASAQRIVCAKFKIPSPTLSKKHQNQGMSHFQPSASSSHIQMPSQSRSTASFHRPASLIEGSDERGPQSDTKVSESSSGPRGSLRKDLGMNAGGEIDSEADVNVNVRTSINEDEGGGKFEKRKGKERQDKIREVQGAEKTTKKQEETEWIIMDMCDDNDFTSILRILHRHASHPINSSFLPRSSTIISSTEPSPNSSSPLSPGFSFSPVSIISPFSQSIISPYDSSDVYEASAGALPYPEWRIKLVNRARMAGLGDIGLGMERLLVGQNEEDSISTFGSVGNVRPMASAIKGRKAVESDSSRQRSDENVVTASVESSWTAGAREVQNIWNVDQDQESDGPELSDCEWEGWMRDLDRQRHAEELRQTYELSRVQSSPPSYVPSSAPSSRSSAESLPVLPRTSAYSPVMSSSSGIPWISAKHRVFPDFHPIPALPSDSSSNRPDLSAPLPVHKSPIAVSSGSGESNVRRRSSTVTAESAKLLRKNDKGKEKATTAPNTGDSISRPRSVLPSSGVEDSESAQILTNVPTGHYTPRRSILRHVRSSSSLPLRGRGKKAEATSAAIDPGTSNAQAGHRRSTEPTKDVSRQAERPITKGWWDSALDFVSTDGMNGFGAGSFYG